MICWLGPNPAWASGPAWMQFVPGGPVRAQPGPIGVAGPHLLAMWGYRLYCYFVGHHDILAATPYKSLTNMLCGTLTFALLYCVEICHAACWMATSMGLRGAAARTCPARLCCCLACSSRKCGMPPATFCLLRPASRRRGMQDSSPLGKAVFWDRLRNFLVPMPS